MCVGGGGGGGGGVASAYGNTRYVRTLLFVGKFLARSGRRSGVDCSFLHASYTNHACRHYKFPPGISTIVRNIEKLVRRGPEGTCSTSFCLCHYYIIPGSHCSQIPCNNFCSMYSDDWRSHRGDHELCWFGNFSSTLTLHTIHTKCHTHL